MKIAHIIFSFQTGGSETMLVDIINYQAKNEQVALFIINNSLNEGLVKNIDAQVSVYRINRKPRTKNPLPLLKLNTAIYQFEPDIMHFHNHNAINSILPFLRKKPVLTLHTTGITSVNAFKYKKVFSISEAVKQEIKSRSDLATQVVYNGVDIGQIEHIKELKENAAFRILQVGRLDHTIKGQHISLEAVGLLIEKGYDINMSFIGDGPSEAFLKEMVCRKGIDKKVIFLGARDRAYVYKTLKDYDLLIQPSFYEGFGLTITEAIAAKVPVLVSDIEGPMEIIEKGKFGYFFEKGNGAAAAGQIVKIMNMSEAEKNDLINSAYEHVVAKFDIKNTATRYLTEYASL